MRIMHKDGKKLILSAKNASLPSVLRFNRISLVKDDIEITDVFKMWNDKNTMLPIPEKNTIADYCV